MESSSGKSSGCILSGIFWNADGWNEEKRYIMQELVEREGISVVGACEVKCDRAVGIRYDWWHSDIHLQLTSAKGKLMQGSFFTWANSGRRRVIYGKRLLALVSGDVLLILVYVHPKTTAAEFDELLTELKRLLREHRHKMAVVGGDLNARPGTTRRNKLDQWMRQHGMMNVQHEDSFFRGNAHSQLDLVVVHAKMQHRIETKLHALESDHHAVQFTIRGVDARAPNPTDTRRRLTKKELREFESNLKFYEEVLKRPLHDRDISADAMVEEFEETLFKVVSSQQPYAKRKKRMDGIPKTRRLRKLYQQYFSLKEKMKGMPSEHRARPRRRVKRLLASIKQEVAAIREKRLTKFAERVNDNPNTFFRIRKRAERRNNLPQVDAQTLANHFSQADAELTTDEKRADTTLAPVLSGTMAYEYPTPSADEVRLLNEPFQASEVKAAVLNTAPNKAPGKCGVTGAMLRAGGPTLWRLLTELYNRCWREHAYPKHFREGVVSAVRKPNKPAREPNSHRPITLLCCVHKTMEKMINTRLARFLERRTHPEQRGFRSKRSAVQQIYELQHAYSTYGERATVLALDATAAFDRIDREAALDEARRRGVSHELAEADRHFEGWMRQVLVRPSIRTVRVGAWTSSEYELHHGTAQGSCVSPTVFLLCSDRLLLRARLYLRRIGRLNDGQVLGYADDLAAVARDPQLCSEIANEMRSEAQSINLVFNASKTGLLSREREASITFGGETVKSGVSVRYLGATITRSGHTTVQLLAGKLNKSLEHVRWLLRRPNLNLKVKARMIHAAILPMTLYACSVCWYEKRTLQKMDSVVMTAVHNAVRVKGQLVSAHKILRNELGVLPTEAYLAAQRKTFIVTHYFDEEHDNVQHDLKDDYNAGALHGPSTRVEHFRVRDERRWPQRTRQPRAQQSETLSAHEAWRQEVRAAVADAKRITRKARADSSFGGRHGDTIRRYLGGEEAVSSGMYARAVAKLLAQETLAAERLAFASMLESLDEKAENDDEERTTRRYVASGRHRWPGREDGALPAYLTSPAAGFILCLRTERLPMIPSDVHKRRMRDDCPLCGEHLAAEDRNEHFTLSCVEMEREWTRTRAAARSMTTFDTRRLMEAMLRLDGRETDRRERRDQRRDQQRASSDMKRLTSDFETELPNAYDKWTTAVLRKIDDEKRRSADEERRRVT